MNPWQVEPELQPCAIQPALGRGDGDSMSLRKLLDRQIVVVAVGEDGVVRGGQLIEVFSDDR